MVSIIGVLLTAFLVGCSSLMYYPSQQLFYDPKKLGVETEDIWVQLQSGERVNGWWISARPQKSEAGAIKSLKQSAQPTHAKGTIVQFHGNAENMSAHYASLLWLINEGYNLVTFDYPGYGVSEGEASPKNTVESGEKILEWIRENKSTESKNLIIYGQSLGGAVALRVALEQKSKHPIRIVVIDSSFHSYQAVGKSVLSKSKITWLFQPLAYVFLSNHWGPKEIEKISPVPMLVIHGDQDPIVDYELGKKVYDLAAEPKELWRIEGGNHIDVFWRENGVYRKKFTDWLEGALGNSPL